MHSLAGNSARRHSKLTCVPQLVRLAVAAGTLTMTSGRMSQLTLTTATAGSSAARRTAHSGDSHASNRSSSGATTTRASSGRGSRRRWGSQKSALRALPCCALPEGRQRVRKREQVGLERPALPGSLAAANSTVQVGLQRAALAIPACQGGRGPGSRCRWVSSRVEGQRVLGALAKQQEQHGRHAYCGKQHAVKLAQVELQGLWWPALPCLGD